MSWRDTLISWISPQQERATYPLSLDDWYGMLQGQWGVLGLTNNGDPQQDIDEMFESRVRQAYASNGVVFACMVSRLMLFSEARFQFRQRLQGRPGDLFGSAELAVLEEPFGPGSTTGDLLAKIITDADLAGNSFPMREGDRIRYMRPDWVSIVFDRDPRRFDAERVGYLYEPGGHDSGIEPELIFPERVAHFMPIPDPLSPWRGMSWLTPIAREIMADSAARDHKLKFFENGATPSLVVKVPVDDIVKFDAWVSKFKTSTEGTRNAYKSLFLGAGAEATSVGTNFQELEFASTTAAGEVRITGASGMHPIVVAINASLQGSSLNQGNFAAAARLTADKTLRPLWRNAAGTLSKLVNVPTAAELWYDDRDIPFLADDQKDAAEVLRMEAEAINRFITAGYKPDAVIDAVKSRDLARLTGQHTGLFSVQLQPAGAAAPPPQLTGGAEPPRALVLTHPEFRCSACNHKLADSAGPGTVIRCRCGTVNEAAELSLAS